VLQEPPDDYEEGLAVCIPNTLEEGPKTVILYDESSWLLVVFHQLLSSRKYRDVVDVDE
jgi:hypothetical protein